MPLKCERPTRTMERRIRSAARKAGIVTSRNAVTVFEHGQWWVENFTTGAQYAVNDANTDTGFDFELVTAGEE